MSSGEPGDKSSVSYGATMRNEMSVFRRIEFLILKRQIEVLSTFIPNEILMHRATDKQRRTFVGVLLFADVSGFTPLTEKYNKTGKGGIYRLTATLNAYIGAIVEVIHCFGGDILKFSGDAFLALWKVKEGECAYDILHRVVVCALIIQKNLGVFETEVNVLLKVKLAISCGNMSFAIIGAEATRYYVIVGEAIYDVKNAEHVSVSGDVVISPAAWSHMLHDRYVVTEAPHGNVKVWKTVYKKNEESKRIYFEEYTHKVLALVSSHLNHRSNVHCKKTFESDFTISKVVENFVKSLPKREEIQRAPKFWTIDDLRPFIIKPVQDQVDESQPVEYLTEMREITIQFINIVPHSFDQDVLIEMCDSCYRIICAIVGEVLGVVNKASLFDKDFMLLVLFGLRGINHEMESQHALRSGFNILKQISEGVKNVMSCAVGVTQGLVYCGVVGHPFRREYTVIGTEVNKAARIMCAYPERVTCDYKTFKHSKLASYYFQLQSAIKLKGIEDAGSIYEYNENFDNDSQASEQHLTIFGRVEEFNTIRTIVCKDEDSQLCNFNAICFYGPPKIGKTAILNQAMRKFRELPQYTTVSLELSSHSSVTYFTISRIYEKLYDVLSMAFCSSEQLPYLPRYLFDPDEGLMLNRDDIGTFKYNILQDFRHILALFNTQDILLFIDNVQFIDVQSWEILEIVLLDEEIKLLVTANFEKTEWKIANAIEALLPMLLFEIDPIDNKYLATLACMFLKAVGIPQRLEYLLLRCSEGRPGHIQSAILRLVNNGSLQLKVINRSERESLTKFVFPPELQDGAEIMTIVEFSERYKHIGQELTLQAISLDLFDSFTPYQQLTIKTAAVLGDMFTRALLIVAMQFPTEVQLSQVIMQLCEEEVFECGAKYVYAFEIDTKLCCRCHFDADVEANFVLPRYAYCKILHFKNKSIREVAYDLLPGNQKKELHLLCTEVIEYAPHTCPVCIRQPINYILRVCKYQQVMAFCIDPKKKYHRWTIDPPDHGDMKRVVRDTMFGTRAPTFPNDIVIRPHYDFRACDCYEIWVRVMRQLRYHADQGKHNGKFVYFTMKYGFVLLAVRDYSNAIRYFREAVELCLIDADKTRKDAISAQFKIIIMGRIETGLAQAHLALGQIQAAKNHITIGLRQYHIPSLAQEYRVFNELLRKTFVVNVKQIMRKAYGNTIVRFDCGNALAQLSKILTLEGHWKQARNVANCSLVMLSGCNTNITLLVDVYCTIIELYAYTDHRDTLEKLQKRVFHDVTLNFISMDIQNVNSMIVLLETLLESHFICGHIETGIRLGYHTLDICMRIDFFAYECRLFYHLPMCLILSMRIRDAGDILMLFKARMNRLRRPCATYYFIVALLVYLHTGFTVEPLDAIVHYATELRQQEAKLRQVSELLFILLQVHFTRAAKPAKADEWKTDITWNSQLVKNSITIVSLIYTLEYRILGYISTYAQRSGNIDVERKRIDKLMELLAEATTAQYTIYIPTYLYYRAWLRCIAGEKRQADKILRKMFALADKTKNVLFACYANAAWNAWTGGYYMKYDKRPTVTYLDADLYTLNELAQFVPTLVIE